MEKSFNKINLVELYQKAFNVRGVKYLIDNNLEVNKRNYTDKKYFDIDAPIVPIAKAYNVLGIPIYETFKLSLLSPYRVGLPQNTLKEYTFPDWPLLDVSGTKNIIKTPIKGKNGTVKEFINIDDYKIVIRGLIINYESQEYPEQAVYDFHQFFKVNDSLVINNSVLNLLDIHQLVITDISFPSLEGFPNVQPYAIQCLSDEPILLTIRDSTKSVRM